jgi:hypothetical protein
MTKHTVNGAGVSALKRLYALENERAKITSEITLEVLRARKNGASWNMIGSSLGTTSQSAWEKFSHRKLESVEMHDVPLPGFSDASEEEADLQRRLDDARNPPPF